MLLKFVLFERTEIGNTWEKYRKYNPRVPWRLETVNQSTLPTLKKKQLWALSYPHHLSVTCPIHAQNPSTSVNLPWNTIIAAPLQFSHSFPLRPSLPWSFLCLLNPDAGEPQSLSVDRTSVQSSVMTGSWKAPGVKVVLGRVYVACSSSFITRRHEFMCENQSD